MSHLTSLKLICPINTRLAFGLNRWGEQPPKLLRLGRVPVIFTWPGFRWRADAHLAFQRVARRLHAREIAGGVFLLHELSAGAPLNFAPVPVWPGLFRCGEPHRERLRPQFLFVAASNYKLRFSLSSRKMIP